MTNFNHVYLVDDDPNTLFLHKCLLKDMNIGQHIIGFLDPKDALVTIKKNCALSKGRNLLLLDLNMPRMSGWEFLNQIYEEWDLDTFDQVKIVVLTSSANSSDYTKSLGYPFVYDHLVKSFSTTEMYDLFQTLIDDEQLVFRKREVA